MEQVSTLFEPIALFFYVFGIIGLLILRYSPSLWFRALTVLILLGYFAFASPLGANLIVGAVEIREPDPPDCVSRKPRVVVILAGGITDSSAIRNQLARLKEESYRRLIDGITWAREINADRVLITGGSGRDNGGRSEASLMAQLAMQMGYPREKLLLDEVAMNTFSSSGTVSRMLGEMQVDTVWMVTSATHMRRARASYEKRGLTICAYPVNSKRVPIDMPYALVPQLSALSKSTDAYREVMGYIYYAMTERL